jgi:hypothetical protein
MPGKRNEERDERVKLPLDPETALRALLAVDPDDEPADDDQDEKRRSEAEASRKRGGSSGREAGSPTHRHRPRHPTP